LSWSFSAEVLTTVIVTLIVGWQARKTTIFVYVTAAVLYSLYSLESIDWS
jgi:hypothetical protein